MDIKFIPISSIDYYENNSNSHPDYQIHQLKAIILEVGFTVPVLLRKGKGSRFTLVAGEGRTRSATELHEEDRPLKMPDGTPIPKDTVPALIAHNWSEEQVRLYVIADNKIAENSEINEQNLASELSFLLGKEVDLSLTGYDEGELEIALSNLESDDDDDTGNSSTQSPPEDFKEIQEFDLNHKCPKCGYEFD